MVQEDKAIKEAVAISDKVGGMGVVALALSMGMIVKSGKNQYIMTKDLYICSIIEYREDSRFAHWFGGSKKEGYSLVMIDDQIDTMKRISDQMSEKQSDNLIRRVVSTLLPPSLFNQNT